MDPAPPALFRSALFFEPQFRHRVLVFRHGLLTGTMPLDTWVNGAHDMPCSGTGNKKTLEAPYAAHVIREEQLVSLEQLRELIRAYPAGAEGDREIRKSNTSLLFELEGHLSRDVPNALACAGVVMALSTDVGVYAAQCELPQDVYWAASSLGLRSEARG
jgi:hypothetical protein